MGIGGSGMSAVAQIASSRGYIVSGCDLQTNTPYIDKVKALGIPVFTGHSADHLQDIDILCVTPAVFYQNDAHPEIEAARQKNILMTWQEFMGKYLHADKFVICIAGTHGKSTTTALTGLLLEQAGFDPTVEVGATVPAWHSNVRIGQSKYFISEADEFHDNFLHYHPDIIILNNLELDHPEYFHSFDQLLDSYLNFVKQLKPNGTLIYNADSPGNLKLLLKIKNLLAVRTTLKISLIPYSFSEYPANLSLKVIGNHNKSNTIAIIKLGQLLHIDERITTDSLSNFIGLERRLELLGEKDGIKVYDDYANHPSSYQANLAALKENYPNSRILTVIEPHTFSRLRALLPELPAAFAQADQVVVSKIFSSRETDPGDFTGQNIVDALHHPHAQYIPEFKDISSYIELHKSSFDIILVMGSGDSYKLSRQILSAL